MKPFGTFFAHVFDRTAGDPQAASRRSIMREWERQRRSALGPSDLAEIDAIFSRHL